MASLFIFDVLNEREKEMSKRVFRDRNNHLGYLNDRKVIERYRLSRRYMYLNEVVDFVKEDIERPTNRSKAIPAVIQVDIIII